MPAEASRLIPVAEYVRMSTDEQRYSIDNQKDVIRAYAGAHGMVIVRTYADAGKSGLDLDRREGLRELLSDVRRSGLEYEMILVYDVTRWGRFQDPDEAASHEFVCRQFGFKVIYCAESFGIEPTPLATLQKNIKRVMAAEYSRELSMKVFAGQARLARAGKLCPGIVGLGLRRAIVGDDGEVKTVLEAGQRRRIQSDRVVLVPGPAHEIELVRRIFRMHTVDGLSHTQIGKILEREGHLRVRGGSWSNKTVNNILINELYIGNIVWGRTGKKLHGPSVSVPPELWCRAENTHTAIVDKSMFEQAQVILRNRTRRLTNDELLTRLRGLFVRNGRLDESLVRTSKDVPSIGTYRRRFGDMHSAYTLVGCSPRWERATSMMAGIARRHRDHAAAAIVRYLDSIGVRATTSTDSRRVTINDTLMVLLVVLFRNVQKHHPPFYALQLRKRRPDFVLAIRVRADAESVLDYYLCPATELPCQRTLRFTPSRTSRFDAFRSDTIGCVEQLATLASLVAQDQLEGL